MDKIRIGISNYNESFLKRNSDSANVLSVVNLISEPFVRMYDGKIWPSLAKSWQVFDDGHRWLFYLRPNILFQDNTPCTMLDVLESIERAKSRPDEFGLPSPYGRYLRKCCFRIVNRLAMEVICDEQNGDVAEILSGIPILKPNRFGNEVIGTGNYNYTNYWPNNTVRLNKKAGLKHLSAYDQITFVILPDPQERIEALRKGNIHFAANVEELEEIPYDRELFWWKCTTNQSVMGLLNAFRKPFCHPAARKAINYAIDKEEIISQVMHGMAIPASTVVSPYHCGYGHTLEPFRYDPEKAKKLFDEAGLDSNLSISVAPGFPDHSLEIAEMLSMQLERIKITLKIEKRSDKFASITKTTENNSADISLIKITANSTYRILRDYISCAEKEQMWQGVIDEPLQEMISHANMEDDITDRERKYANALQHLNHHPHWLYLFHPVSAFACIPEARDVELLHTGIIRFPGSW